MSQHQNQIPGRNELRPIELVSPPDRADLPGMFSNLHRTFRGRYRWVLALSVLTALAGGALGYLTTTPLYVSESFLSVAASQPTLTDPEGVKAQPMLSLFIEERVAFLQQRRVLKRAMESKEWRSLGRGGTEEELLELEESLEVTRPKNGLFILVTCTDEDPRAAMVSVRAIVKAFQDLSSEQSLQQDMERLKTFQKSESDLEAELRDLDQRVLGVAEEFRKTPEALQSLEDVWLRRLAEATASLDEVRRRMGIAGIALNEAGAAPGNVGDDEAHKPLTLGQLRVLSAEVNRLVMERDRAEEQIRVLKTEKHYGAGHAEVLAASREADFLTGQIQGFLDSYNKGRADGTVRIGDQGKGEADVGSLRAEEAYWGALVERSDSEIQLLSKALTTIRRLQSEWTGKEAQLAKTRLVIDQLNAQLVGTGRVEVMADGDLPGSPNLDRRFRNGFLGATGGLAVAGLLLFSLFRSDHRLRNSSDFTDNRQKLRMLGILPMLPGGVADSEAAEMAAHSVHHIRTLLQLSIGRGSSRCFGVTGPAAGTGKSTLSFALGVSFSMAGDRTLVIDCDLSGRGLTRRASAVLESRLRILANSHRGSEAGNGRPEAPNGHDAALSLLGGNGRAGAAGGLSDLLDDLMACAGGVEAFGPDAFRDLLNLCRQILPPARVRDLIPRLRLWANGVNGNSGSSEYARILDKAEQPVGLRNLQAGGRLEDSTELLLGPNLHLLSLGPDDSSAAAHLSVGHVEMMLLAARALFDTVIVDTGPIPGSIEASLVAVNVDSMVLTVSRGDQRELLLRAAAHLESIHAKLAGVVFNRADVTDALRESRSRSRSARSSAPGES